MELLDIYDANGRHLGTKERAAVHRDGDWHEALHCWITAVRGGVPVVLLQRRGYDRSTHPGRLDITAAGHLSAGESVPDALREIEEELGVTVTLDDLVEVGKLRLDITADGLRNREFDYVFLLRDDRALSGYTFCDGSVAGLVEVNLDAFAELVEHGVACPGWSFVDGHPLELIQVTADELVPLGAEYFATVVSSLRAMHAHAQ